MHRSGMLRYRTQADSNSDTSSGFSRKDLLFNLGSNQREEPDLTREEDMRLSSGDGVSLADPVQRKFGDGGLQRMPRDADNSFRLDRTNTRKQRLCWSTVCPHEHACGHPCDIQLGSCARSEQFNGKLPLQSVSPEALCITPENCLFELSKSGIGIMSDPGQGVFVANDKEVTRLSPSDFRCLKHHWNKGRKISDKKISTVRVLEQKPDQQNLEFSPRIKEIKFNAVMATELPGDAGDNGNLPKESIKGILKLPSKSMGFRPGKFGSTFRMAAKMVKNEQQGTSFRRFPPLHVKFLNELTVLSEVNTSKKLKSALSIPSPIHPFDEPKPTPLNQRNFADTRTKDPVRNLTNELQKLKLDDPSLTETETDMTDSDEGSESGSFQSYLEGVDENASTVSLYVDAPEAISGEITTTQNPEIPTMHQSEQCNSSEETNPQVVVCRKIENESTECEKYVNTSAPVISSSRQVDEWEEYSSTSTLSTCLSPVTSDECRNEELKEDDHVESETHQVESETNQVESEINQVESESNQVESESNQVESESNQIESDTNQEQPAEKGELSPTTEDGSGEESDRGSHQSDQGSHQSDQGSHQSDQDSHQGNRSTISKTDPSEVKVWNVNHEPTEAEKPPPNTIESEKVPAPPSSSENENHSGSNTTFQTFTSKNSSDSINSNSSASSAARQRSDPGASKIPVASFRRPLTIHYFDERMRKPSSVMLFTQDSNKNAIERDDQMLSRVNRWERLVRQSQTLRPPGLRGLTNPPIPRRRSAGISFRRRRSEKRIKRHRCNSDLYIPKARRFASVTLRSDLIVKEKMKVEQFISDDFMRKFRLFAKCNDNRKSGIVISKTKSYVWQRKAGLYDGIVEPEYALECFSFFTGRKIVLNAYDYMYYLARMARYKNIEVEEVVSRMCTCSIPQKKKGQVQHQLETKQKSEPAKSMECGDNAESTTTGSTIMGLFPRLHKHWAY